MAQAFPGTVVGVGQDPDGKLRDFGVQFGTSFDVISDAPGYPASERYGLRVVPTLVLVDGGRVVDLVESWERDGYNRVSAGLAELTGARPTQVSTSDDGLPSFRPG
jgi:hypothetical protein